MYLADLEDLLIPLLILAGPAILHTLSGKKKKEAREEAARERAASKPDRAEGRTRDSHRARPGRQRVPDPQPVQPKPGVKKPDWAWRNAGQPASSPSDVEKDLAEATQELPAWLNKLAEDLGGPQIKESLEGRENRSDFESIEVSPVGLEESGPQAEGLKEEGSKEGDPLETTEQDSSWRCVADADSSAYKQSLAHGKCGEGRRHGRLFGTKRSAWQQAIVLHEILGQPRALNDWREVKTAGER